MTSKFRLVGINDDAHTCSCCGRSDLKRVLWLMPLDPDGNAEGEAIPFGSSCAARALGWAYPTRSATKRKIEGDAFVAMVTLVNDTMSSLIKHYLTRGTGRYACYLIPPICVGPLARGEITLEKAIELRERLHPLFAYLSNKITVQEAFAIIQKGNLG